MWTVNFQMCKLDLEKPEDPEIKLSTSVGSLKKQEGSRKKIYFCFIDYAKTFDCVHFSSVTQSCPTLLTPQTTVCQASLSISNSRSLLKFMSIESVMPSNRLILCCPLLLLPSIYPSLGVFSNELALGIRWPMSCNFSTSPSNEYSGLIPFRTDWFDLFAVQGTLKSLLQHHNSKASVLQRSVFFIVYGYQRRNLVWGRRIGWEFGIDLCGCGVCGCVCVLVACRGPARLIQGVRSGDGVGEDKDTIASIRY